jgi:integrase/recombinase XerD
MPKSHPIPIKKEEMDKILEASMEDDFSYTLFYLAKTTGRRLGEYYDLKVKDIDFENKRMITLVLKRKKRVEKEAILNDEATRLLKRWVINQKLKLDDYLFKKFSYRHIQNLPKKYAKKAGINKNVSFHNFRHYFITELVRKGWTYDKIMKLTGHSSLSTLTIYDSSTSRDIEKEARTSIQNI